MYEALKRLVWKWFRPWIAENHKESKDLIEDSFQELDLLYLSCVKNMILWCFS